MVTTDEDAVTVVELGWFFDALAIDLDGEFYWVFLVR